MCTKLFISHRSLDKQNIGYLSLVAHFGHIEIKGGTSVAVASYFIFMSSCDWKKYDNKTIAVLGGI